MQHNSRESWLLAAAEEFRPWFKDHGHDYPEKLRVSCGMAGGRIGGKRIGECWTDECSADKAREIFISPVLDEPTRVLDVLLHEIVHAVLPFEVKHGPQFAKLAMSLGLTGKMTATVATPELHEKLVAIVNELGPYPHAALCPTLKEKQTTRLLKIQCPECGYVLRGTAKWVEVGLPTCCCGTEMEVAA